MTVIRGRKVRRQSKAAPVVKVFTTKNAKTRLAGLMVGEIGKNRHPARKSRVPVF